MAIQVALSKYENKHNYSQAYNLISWKRNIHMSPIHIAQVELFIEKWRVMVNIAGRLGGILLRKFIA